MTLGVPGESGDYSDPAPMGLLWIAIAVIVLTGAWGAWHVSGSEERNVRRIESCAEQGGTARLDRTGYLLECWIEP